MLERLRVRGEGDDEAEMIGWHHQLNGMSLRKVWEIVKDRVTCCAIVHGIPKSQISHGD